MTSEVIQITGEEVASDIRNGMSDAELIVKYGLSARHLLSLFKKLVSANLISEKELEDRLDLFAAEEDLQLALQPLVDVVSVPGLPTVKWKFKCDGWVFFFPDHRFRFEFSFFWKLGWSFGTRSIVIRADLNGNSKPVM